MKMLQRIFNIVLAVLLAAGVAGGAMLFLQRDALDRANRHVALVMDYYDTAMLETEEKDVSVLELLRESGLSAVTLSENDGTAAAAVKKAGLPLGYSPIRLSDAGAYLADADALGCGFSLLLSRTLPAEGQERLAGAGLTAAVRIDVTSGTDTAPEGLRTDLMETLPAAEAPDRGTWADGVPDLSGNLDLVVSAVDRAGARAVILTPFFDEEGAVVTDVTVYTDYLTALTARLESLGYTPGPALYTPEAADTSPLPAILLFCGLCAAVLLFVGSFGRLPIAASIPLLVFLLAAAVLGGLFRREFTEGAFSLAARIAVPCLAFRWAVDRAVALWRSNGNYGIRAAVFYSAGVTFVAGLILIAGETAANLLFLDLEALSGHLSFPLPTLVNLLIALYVVYLLFAKLYRDETSNFSEHLGGLFYSLRSHAARTLAIVLVLVLAVLIYVLALRAQILALGDLLADLWYRLTGASPRAVQYLLTYPAMSLGLLLCARRRRGVAWPFLLFSAGTAWSVGFALSTAAEPLARCVLGVLLADVLGFVFSVLYGKAETAAARRSFLRAAFS